MRMAADVSTGFPESSWASVAGRGEDEMQTSYLRGVLFCLVATVSWGCMFPVMTSALTRMDPFNFTAIRYTIAAIPFAVLLLAREGKGAFNLKSERHLLAWLFGTAGFAGFGFLMFLGKLFLVELMKTAQSNRSGWVDYMWPKPGQSQPSQKWSYVKAVKIDGAPGYVAAGFYP
jgi:EamA-like transporter family/Cache domain